MVQKRYANGKSSLGTKEMHANAYYGIQTARG